MARRTRMLLATAFWLGLAAVAGVRCGRSGKDKQDDPAPTPTTATVVPADWDGQSDWSGSAMEVVDE